MRITSWEFESMGWDGMGWDGMGWDTGFPRYICSRDSEVAGNVVAILHTSQKFIGFDIFNALLLAGLSARFNEERFMQRARSHREQRTLELENGRV
jgi:hypothetical protein